MPETNGTRESDSASQARRSRVVLWGILGLAASGALYGRTLFKDAVASQATRRLQALQPAHPPAPTEEPVSWRIDGAEVLDEETQDTPIKTQVTLKFSVPRTTTKEALDRYLRGLYAATVGRTGFEHHKHPNSVYAFVFYEGADWQANPTGWVGRIAKSAMDDAPTFDNNLHGGDVVHRAQQALDTNPGPLGTHVAAADDGLQITTHLTELGSTEYAPTLDKKEAWQHVFLVYSLLFAVVPDAGTVHLDVKYRDTTVIAVALDYGEFNQLEYERVVNEIGDKEAKLDELRIQERISENSYEQRRQQAYLQGFKKLVNRIPEEQRTIVPKVRL